jgi:RHS repeat-associated protein
LNVAQRIDYDEFGQILRDDNPGFQFYSFAGGHIANVMLMGTDYRFYSSDIGRWTTKDPIGFNGGDTNLYGYVLNDPVNFVDPTGLASECTRPLNFLPGEAGYVSHDFVCYTGSDGKAHCGGLGPQDLNFFSSPGKIEPDQPNSTCKDKGNDNCMNQCVENQLNTFVPRYHIIGSNCHDYAQTVISTCRAVCGGSK